MIKFILDSDSGQLRVMNFVYSRQISIWAYHGTCIIQLTKEIYT